MSSRSAAAPWLDAPSANCRARESSPAVIGSGRTSSPSRGGGGTTIASWTYASALPSAFRSTRPRRWINSRGFFDEARISAWVIRGCRRPRRRPDGDNPADLREPADGRLAVRGHRGCVGPGAEPGGAERAPDVGELGLGVAVHDPALAGPVLRGQDLDGERHLRRRSLHDRARSNSSISALRGMPPSAGSPPANMARASRRETSRHSSISSSGDSTLCGR